MLPMATRINGLTLIFMKVRLLFFQKNSWTLPRNLKRILLRPSSKRSNQDDPRITRDDLPSPPRRSLYSKGDYPLKMFLYPLQSRMTVHLSVKCTAQDLLILTRKSKSKLKPRKRMSNPLVDVILPRPFAHRARRIISSPQEERGIIRRKEALVKGLQEERVIIPSRQGDDGIRRARETGSKPRSSSKHRSSSRHRSHSVGNSDNKKDSSHHSKRRSSHHERKPSKDESASHRPSNKDIKDASTDTIDETSGGNEGIKITIVHEEQGEGQMFIDDKSDPVKQGRRAL